MTKTKTPFFSLGSKGSVADTLTSQKRGVSTLIRSKPSPTYRRTLPQLYQRWLYEDYAYLWTQQSAATRAEYRTGGSRFHLTAFQYWIKYHLTNLPDISLFYKLDTHIGTLVLDSSRHSNNGILFGPSYQSGQISTSLYFDGLNDYLSISTPSAMAFGTGDFSLCFFLWLEDYTNPPGDSSTQVIVSSTPDHIDDWGMNFRTDNFPIIPDRRQLHFFCRNSAGLAKFAKSPPITKHTWYLVSATRYNSNLYISLSGQNWIPGDVAANRSYKSPSLIYLGKRIRFGNRHFYGLLDNFIIYSRYLNNTELYIRSLRQFPS